MDIYVVIISSYFLFGFFITIPFMFFRGLSIIDISIECKKRNQEEERFPRNLDIDFLCLQIVNRKITEKR